MINAINKDRLFWGLWLLWTFFILWGVSLIPFHPDETSILYQSRDFESLLSNPASLAWNPDTPDDYDQTYRLLNGPLPKYVLGLARRLGGYAAELVSIDWNWSLSWDENVAAGALPSDELLSAARLLNTLLLSAAMPLMYFSAKQLGGTPTGIAAAALFGSNALLLLHARRAMSEAALIFVIAFSLWAMLNARVRPWLLGLAVGLAVTAKLSAAPLVLIGLIVVLWRTGVNKDRIRLLAGNAVKFLGVFGLTVYVLTPL
ncbi:MAG: phospholipid carrier-dependent glycosyltransferase, partial [Chloroflexota bacterium]